MIPYQTHQFVDIKWYANAMINSGLKPEEIANDTYVCAMFLPETFSNHLYIPQFAIKHPDVPGIDTIRQNVPYRKHLSQNTVAIQKKMIKKVQEIRHFSKIKSVFRGWKEDNNKLLSDSFDIECDQMKIKKFIKDEKDLAQTKQVLKKYFGAIKNQFNTSIATPKSYPVVDWLDFVEMCHKWKLVDKNLTSQDIDRIFISTNFEEEDLEENDDNSLCRFEYLEIIARMAKTKFFEKGICKTVHESLEKLLLEYIIPNSIEQMEWQEFRENKLYTLEVDDLFKANLAAIEKLFKQGGLKPGRNARKYISKDEVLDLQAACSAKAPFLIKQENKTVLAYSLSKMTIKNEMGDYDKYNQMQMVEFFEFIGRWAELLFQDLKIPL